MPRLTYTQEGADPKVWDFAFGRLMSPERIAIEKATGMAWMEVQHAFFRNSGVVLQALLWVLLKRDMPTLQLDDVVFCDDEIDLDLTDAEALESLDRLRAKSVLDDDEREALASLEARGLDPKAED